MVAQVQSVAQLAAAWGRHLVFGRNLSPKTVRTYTGLIKGFVAYLEFRSLPVQAVDYHILEDWMAHLRSEEKAAKGIKDRICIVGEFFKWMIREGVVERNPRHDLYPIQVEERVPKFWTEEQTLAVINGARSTRDRAILETLYATAARESEVRGIDLVNRGGPVIVMGKGRRERVLQFGGPALSAIAAWIPERAELLRGLGRECEVALFVSSLGRRISYTPFRKVVVDAAKRAGIDGPASPHMFRHSAATHMLDRGADLRYVQETLGHRSIESTKGYTHVAQAKLREVYSRFHPRGGTPENS